MTVTPTFGCLNIYKASQLLASKFMKGFIKTNCPLFWIETSKIIFVAHELDSSFPSQACRLKERKKLSKDCKPWSIFYQAYVSAKAFLHKRYRTSKTRTVFKDPALYHHWIVMDQEQPAKIYEKERHFETIGTSYHTRDVECWGLIMEVLDLQE